jgi:hypothetical protein
MFNSHQQLRQCWGFDICQTSNNLCPPLLTTWWAFEPLSSAGKHGSRSLQYIIPWITLHTLRIKLIKPMSFSP